MSLAIPSNCQSIARITHPIGAIVLAPTRIKNRMLAATDLFSAEPAHDDWASAKLQK